MCKVHCWIKVIVCDVLLVTVANGSEGVGVAFVPNSIEDSTIHSVLLSDLDDSGFLSGDAVDVTNAVIARASSVTHEFLYDPDASLDSRIHFAETMTYYHVTSYCNHVRSLGFNQLDSRVSAVVFNGVLMQSGHLWSPARTAYNVDTRTISLGITTDGADSDAMDGDVIVHEYSHAVQHALRGGGPGPFLPDVTTVTEQGGAFLEGLADFAAASHFDDPEVGEYSAGIWRGRAFWRDVDNTRRWPPDFFWDTTHAIGTIFSGAMWDLRAVVGAHVAETLALETTRTVPDSNPGTSELNTTFTEALDTVRQVDSDLYGGIHDDTICQAFAVHGVGSYDFSTPFPMVRDPGNDYDDGDAMPLWTVSDADALAVTFDQFVTKLEDLPYLTDFGPYLEATKTTVDYLEILDGDNTVIGTYTGRELQGQTITVPGDTVKFHLVTDSYLPSFGYRVVDISAVFDLETAFGILNETFGSRTDLRADFNGDGRVDLDDFAILRADWEAEAAPASDCPVDNGTPIPEPTTFCMLVLGGLAVLRRQRLAK